MKAFAVALILGLLACTKAAPNPVELAKACITDQVPEGTMVAEVRAREVLTHCAPQLDAWSRYSIEGSLQRPFDDRDHTMQDAWLKHRSASQTYWLWQLSEPNGKSKQ